MHCPLLFCWRITFEEDQPQQLHRDSFFYYYLMESKFEWRHFCVELACSPRVYVGFSRYSSFLWHSRNMPVDWRIKIALRCKHDSAVYLLGFGSSRHACKYSCMLSPPSVLQQSFDSVSFSRQKTSVLLLYFVTLSDSAGPEQQRHEERSVHRLPGHQNRWDGQ